MRKNYMLFIMFSCDKKVENQILIVDIIIDFNEKLKSIF
jgi:hypothetical protein